jgi:hypothetical protein
VGPESKSAYHAEDVTDETKSQATRAQNPRATDEDVEPSIGNVFAELHFRDAEERLLKAKLATKIAQLIEYKSWTPTPSRAVSITTCDLPDWSRVPCENARC